MSAEVQIVVAMYYALSLSLSMSFALASNSRRSPSAWPSGVTSYLNVHPHTVLYSHFHDRELTSQYPHPDHTSHPGHCVTCEVGSHTKSSGLWQMPESTTCQRTGCGPPLADAVTAGKRASTERLQPSEIGPHSTITIAPTVWPHIQTRVPWPHPAAARQDVIDRVEHAHT